MNQERRQPVIVGLDLGSTKTVAIAGRMNTGGKIEILGFGQSASAGVQHGSALNIEQCTHSAEQALEQCLLSNPLLEINEVFVGLTGEHVKCLHSRGDRIRINPDEEISHREIELLIADQHNTTIPEGYQVLDIIPQQYTVDRITGINQPVGMRGTKLGADFKIMIADADAVNSIRRCINKCGLQVRNLQLQPVSSALAVADAEDMEAGVAIIDIGGGTTDLAVYHEGILKYASVVPAGGIDITEDIHNEMGLLRSVAEQVKKQYGTAIATSVDTGDTFTVPGLRDMPSRELSQRKLGHIIQTRMTDILEYVMFSLKQTKLTDKLHGGILLTGGGATLNNIADLTRHISGMGVRIGYPSRLLAEGFDNKLTDPSYATAIGLLISGCRDFENNRMMLAGEGGNYLRIPHAEVLAESPIAVSDEGELVVHKKHPVRNIISGIRNRFMSIFETEDVEL